MARSAPSTTSTSATSEVGRAEARSGGHPGRGRRDEAGRGADGRAAHGPDPAPAQPGRRLRLPGLRLAGPRPGPPAHRGVLRERRQGRRRGGHPAPGRPRSSSPSTRIAELRRAHRLLAGPAGPAHRADGAPARAARHYEPISWDDAFALIADHLRELDSPDEAVFYTSGRTSNEAAFLYQLFVRALRHQQPARLLQHVPRVDRRRARARRSASARAASRSRTSTTPS